MKDYRVEVTVKFTIDLAADEKRILDSTDVAERITREVFKKSFSRAHLLSIECQELMELE